VVYKLIKIHLDEQLMALYVMEYRDITFLPMKYTNFYIYLMFIIIGTNHVSASGVYITSKLFSAEVIHNGEKVIIMRNQDLNNTVNHAYAKTSRKCPPFCIQPAKVATGVDTIGELEVIGYLENIGQGDNSILIIDSRTPDWVENGTIPGSINIPWKKLNTNQGADPFIVEEILQNKFDVRKQEGLWDFSNAKTLVLFCNGIWCGQSPSNIKTLLRIGYSAEKLKWYRGFMQNWENLGLTLVK